MYTEDAGGAKAGGVVVRDGGLGIGCAERVGGVPVGGKLRFDRAGMMETVEDGLNVSRHLDLAGALDVIPFEGYTAKFCAAPVLMNSFIICEQDV